MPLEKLPSVIVWGVPFAPLTFAQTVEQVGALVKAGRPSFFITMNLHSAKVAATHPRFQQAIQEAAFVVADGMPLVWASRLAGTPLPERVTGSDLFPALCQQAARKGHRVFLLGGAPGIADAAAQNLSETYPGLQIVGTESPPFRDLTAEEEAQLNARIRAAMPHVLFVTFGQPKGELWILDHYRNLGVPVCVQVGAALDFAAGRVPRAPRWLQKAGMEWTYRLYREPRRLCRRYLQDFRFFLGKLWEDWWKG
jgi:N-acetylglucosaminyldiphosphoundecaprenol N-acetyl-beta-D-mannosaminyltransferase